MSMHDLAAWTSRIYVVTRQGSRTGAWTTPARAAPGEPTFGVGFDNDLRARYYRFLGARAHHTRGPC